MPTYVLDNPLASLLAAIERDLRKPPERHCQWPDCITILNSWNKGRFCYAHEDQGEAEYPIIVEQPVRAPSRRVDEETAVDMYERWKAGEEPAAIAAHYGFAACTADTYIRAQMRHDPNHKGRVTLRRPSGSTRAEARSTASVTRE